MRNVGSFRITVWIGLLLHKVMGSSVFEVSVLKLNNNRGVNQYGRCCSGARTTPPCTAQCQTYFTVCLMHSIQSMNQNPSCTYGSSQTAVFDGNNLIFLEFNTTGIMKIPISFTWPGRCTLLVEAWHKTSSNISRKDPGQLIIRSVISNLIYPSLSWRGETSSTPTTEMQFKYRLICNQHFYGKGCDVMCRSRDDQFGHYICNENGTRICMDGWNGTFCDQAFCSEECLKNRGFCERPLECRCPLGWYGPNCKQCQRHSGCLNGVCFEPYQCICKDGWAGILCDVDLNYCLKTQPCMNGGTCVGDMDGNYTCLCPETFEGQNCQAALCFNGYCQNGGLCERRESTRVCTCTEDFYGEVCQHKKLKCNDITCHNGGSCRFGSNGGMCECHKNTTGRFCETHLDACMSSPCDNGARCIATLEGYKCDCLPNFAGRHCSYKINPCYNFKCDNGGQCVVKKGNFKPLCECPDGFLGEKCQIALDPCHNIDCLNGGTCRPSPMGNGFICLCADNYYGEFCEERSDLCASFPCKNDAKCKNYMTSYLCICTSHYYGEHCEQEIMLSDNRGKDGTNKENDTTNEYINIVRSSARLPHRWLVHLLVISSLVKYLLLNLS